MNMSESDDVQFSAPVEEDAAATSADPYSFPEEENWDDDDFGEESPADGQESSIKAEAVGAGDNVIIAAPPPPTVMNSDSIDSQSEQHDDDSTGKVADSSSANTMKQKSSNISSEKRRQRRERRQIKHEGQKTHPQEHPIREPPQPVVAKQEQETKAVVDEVVETPPQLTRRQRMAERVAKGKVTLKVKPKSIFQDDNKGSASSSPPVTSPPPPQSPEPHLFINTSNEVELLIDDEEIQQAKDETDGLLIQAHLDPSSLNSSKLPSASVPADKNDARRQRRLNRNKFHEKGEKTTLELLVMAETALGSNEVDKSGEEVVKEEIVKSPPLMNTIPLQTKTETHHTLSSCPEVCDTADEDVDPIIASRISSALDDARVMREAKIQKGTQNGGANADSTAFFDVAYDSKDLLNEEDAKQIFPTQDALNIPAGAELSGPMAPEADWDTERSSTLNNVMDKSRAHNKRMAKTVDDKPLLQLETVPSDNNDKDSLEAISSSKLLSQKERIALYTSGEGFGVGDDSSVDHDDAEDCAESVADDTDDDYGNDEVGYNDLSNFDDDNYEITDEVNHGLDQSEVGKISHTNVPTFNAEVIESSKERAQRWSSNPDAVSDIDDESDICLTTTASAINELAEEKKESSAALLKIPPPPPEKLQQWLNSKNVGKSPTAKTRNMNELELPPPTPKPTTSRDNEATLNTSPYKITTPKSPSKKKPNTIIEELDLKSHKKMAERIAFASSKAAKKFEEEYSHGHGNVPAESHSPPSKSSTSPDRNVLMPTVGELVGGAFSPWRIPDRGDDESMMSLNRAFSDNESFSNVTAAALRAMKASAQEGDNSAQKDDKLPQESFEVSIHLDDAIDEDEEGALTEVLQWLFDEVLPESSSIAAAFSAFDLNISTTVQADRIRAIANDDESFNEICKYVTSAVMSQHSHKIVSQEPGVGGITGIEPFIIPTLSGSRPKAEVLATSFTAFLQQISNLAEEPLPWGENNPLLDSVMNNLSTTNLRSNKQRKTMQDLVFPDEDSVIIIFQYLRKVCGRYQTHSAQKKRAKGHNRSLSPEFTHDVIITVPSNTEPGCSTVRRSNQRNKRMNKAPAKPKNPLNKELLSKLNNLNLIVPRQSPSPFETAVWNDPSIILSVLSFVGNPVTVCVVKRLNVFCNRVVCENEHVLMRDAVRLGGMSKYVRPSFWLWVTEKCQPEAPIPLIPESQGLCDSSEQQPEYQGRDFRTLKDLGAAGKWHPIIERDVTRAFGNMPPHKTGARYRQDSIVRALVTFGKEELMRTSRSYQRMDRLPEGSQAKHFKLNSRLDNRKEGDGSSDGSLTPTDTVSDWGGISPVASYTSEDHIAKNTENPKVQIVSYESMDTASKSKVGTVKSDISDPVLCGNALTNEMKVDMQNKLRSILHALAARHQGVGYCQGMDYIVAHLLRVLQDTILLRVIKAEDWHTMPNEMLRERMSEINSNTEIVEEVVFRVMDTFFTTYSLQHMYWPELRCLKTCCRVFEILIRQKLPVLADHFEHHDLNVGLFALGWFQTLFLYLPSMPSATVCHMWDIWLVERSFKIFFRVGTAILFLSQPTLLNHDLEGMMTYLNTFPDATLLRADILIPCALQIKITNRMLVEIEMEATNFTQQGQPPRM